MVKAKPRDTKFTNQERVSITRGMVTLYSYNDDSFYKLQVGHTTVGLSRADFSNLVDAIYLMRIRKLPLKKF